MTTISKLFIAFGIVILGVILSIIGFAFFMIFVFVPMSLNKSIELDKKRTAETSGTITSVSQFRSSGDQYSAPAIHSTYDYQYVISGVTYDAEQMDTDGKDGDAYKQGLKIKVCFDPADPKSSEFYYLQDNKTCGK